ncbi:MAG: hypothetical protein KAJ19_25560 [Gammaproteobacteria bacterium]|nr:hypothetical protein [Gammaproteobacteria bacterium]
MKTLIVLLPLFLLGCATTKTEDRPPPEFYGRLGIGYQIDDLTDHYLQTEREWNCKNPSAYIQLGVKTSSGYYCELMHRSWYRCGMGSNRDPETYYNDFVCGKETNFEWFKKIYRKNSRRRRAAVDSP